MAEGRAKRRAARRKRGAPDANGAPATLEGVVALLDAGEGGLLGEVARFIRRFVVMSPAQLVATSLWIVHAHAITAAEQTAYLAITSPDRQCGKTRLMEVLELLVPRPWRFETPSEAVLYRRIHHETPTVFWDEIDTVFNPRTADRYEAQRAVLNAGNRRGATVPRMVGTKGLADFSVYCAKALAGIGTLPDTVADRALPIRLERQKRAEKAERFRRRDVEPVGHALRDQAAAWADAHVEDLVGARPKMPDELSDRMQDACEPLFAIADRMDKPWPGLAAAALVELCTGERLDDVETMRLALLRDLKSIFEKLDCRRISTRRLLRELREVPESRWKNYYGHPFEDRDLANLLRHYGIHSQRIRFKGQSLMGYRSRDLYDAWERYT